MTKAATTAKANWARANRLAELADVPPNTARSYISRLKYAEPEEWTSLTTLLDEGKDSRSPIIREHIADTKTHQPPPRASKGDPNRPPRAGAPPETIQGPTDTDTNGEPTIELLKDLAKLAKKHGGLRALTQGVARLHDFQL